MDDLSVDLGPEVKSVQIGRCRRIIRQSLDDYIAGLIDGVG